MEEINYMRTKYETCEKLFNSEIARKEMIDTKGNIYLIFVASITVVIFTGGQTIAETWRMLLTSTIGMVILFAVPYIVFWITLFIAIFCLLQTLSPRKWRVFRPTKKITDLLLMNSNQNPIASELFEELFLEMLACWDFAMHVNDIKAKWLIYSVHAIFISMISFIICIILYSSKMIGLF